MTEQAKYSERCDDPSQTRAATAASPVGGSRESAPSTSLAARLSLRHSPQLRRLNETWQFPAARVTTESPTPPSLLSRIRHGVLSRVRALLYPGEAEAIGAALDFNQQLVQFLNALVDTVTLPAERLDTELAESLEWARHEAATGNDAVRRELHGELNGVRRQLAAQAELLQTTDRVVRGVERILSLYSRQPAPTNGTDSTAHTAVSSQVAELTPRRLTEDVTYVLLENRYRGSEEEIAARVQPYTALFQGSNKPVLEIGAGRGELQRAFRASAISSYGIELDPAMTRLCTSNGLDVRTEEALTHLRGLEDRSLGGIIAIQVVEHLPLRDLKELFALAARKVSPGGRIVTETIHTASLVALAHNYMRDPTHTWPLHPETLRFLSELGGLEHEEIRLLSPYPEGAMLQPLPIDELLPPLARERLEIMNRNLSQLNGLLYGFQDYALISRVPAQGEGEAEGGPS